MFDQMGGVNLLLVGSPKLAETERADGGSREWPGGGAWLKKLCQLLRKCQRHRGWCHCPHLQPGLEVDDKVRGVSEPSVGPLAPCHHGNSLQGLKNPAPRGRSSSEKCFPRSRFFGVTY